MDRATPEATARLTGLRLDGASYRAGWDALTIAGLGLGGGPGRPDIDQARGGVPAQVHAYLRRGGNLLDAQEAEAAVGDGLAAALAAGDVHRDEVVVCAQGGRLRPGERDLIDAEAIHPDEIVAGYCFAPAVLRGQIRRSLATLRLVCLDLFWLAGADALYGHTDEAGFRLRLREAFAALEVAAAQREIAAYGLSLVETAFPPDLALEIARDVIGDRHHLRAVKVPAQPTDGEWLDAATRLGLYVLTTDLLIPGALAAVVSASDL